MSSEGDAAPRPWVAPGSAPAAPPAVPQPAGYPQQPAGYAPPPAGYPQQPAGYPQQPLPGWTPPVPGAAGLEFRPGIVPLRPLTLGDVWGGVTKAIRGNVAATMGLAVITSLVCLVPTTALGAWVASLETADFETGFGVYGLLGQYLPGLGSVVASVGLTGFLAYVIGQAVLGRKVSAGETWEGTRRRLPAVAGAVVLSVLGSLLVLALLLGPGVALLATGGDALALPVLVLVLGLLAALVAFLWLWTRFAFVTAVIVLEGRGVVGGFTRSWRLTAGSQFWRILGIRLLTAVVVGIAAQVITFPISIIGVLVLLGVAGEEYLYVGQAVLTGVATLISGAVTTPFTAGVDALLAVDQRIRREALDVQLIHAARGAQAAPWPTAARPA